LDGFIHFLSHAAKFNFTFLFFKIRKNFFNNSIIAILKRTARKKKCKLGLPVIVWVIMQRHRPAFFFNMVEDIHKIAQGSHALAD